MTIITNLRILLIAMWLGAALFLSAIAAPGAFAVLRSYHLSNANEIAGAVVNRSLTAINVSGVVISLILLLSVFFGRRQYRSRAFLAEVISLFVMLAATGIGHWVISAKLRALRVGLAMPIDQMSASDPRRISFNCLHSYSVKALGIAMIAALVAFACSAYSSRTKF